VSFADIEAAIGPDEPWGEVFDPAMTDRLPDPAARMLRHAIEPGTPLAREVRLQLSGSVVQNGRRLPLTAQERLVPLHGFTWTARGRIGPVWVVVRDHYHAGQSAVDVRGWGLLPLGGERSADTTTSSRGRLAAESLWVPSMLLPQDGVVWTPVDDDRARVELTIDGTTESMVLRVAEDGRLVEATMQRWGRVRAQRHERIPYGFRVGAERAFGGYVIASELEGGWWYGTDSFQPASASRFTVTAASFA
jgi:hypothetical protein